MAAPSGGASTRLREAPDIPPPLSDSPVVSSALPGIPPFPIQIGIRIGIGIADWDSDLSLYLSLDSAHWTR